MFKHFYTLIMAFAMLCCAQTAAAYTWKFGDSNLNNRAFTSSDTWKADIENYDWTSSDENQKIMVMVLDLSRCVKGTEENLFSIAHGSSTDIEYNLNTSTNNGLSSSMVLHVYFTNGDTPKFRLRFWGKDYTVTPTIPDLTKVVFTFSNGRGLSINSEDACWVNSNDNLTKCLMYNQSDGHRVFFQTASSNHGYAIARVFGNGNNATFVYTGWGKKKITGTIELSDQTEYSESWIKERLGASGTYQVNRTFEAGNWYTFSSPVDMGGTNFKTIMGNAKVRVLSSVEGNVVKFTEMTDHYFYGQPVLVCPSTTVTNPTFSQRINNITPLTETATGSGIQFVPTWAPKELATDGTELFLGDGNKFYKPTEEDKTMPGLRAYLKVPTGNTISYVAEIDGVATSLSEIDGGRLVQNTDTRVFNLQGQLVGNSLNGLQPGLYIQGGKKVAVK